jgi:signal transduction histidine kinase
MAGQSTHARSLSARLLGLTIVVVLLAESLVFIRDFTRARVDWLERRATEAQIAALSVAVAPEGMLDRRTRDELLRLSGTEAIRLRETGRDVLVGAPDDPAATPAARIDLSREMLPQAVFRAFRLLLPGAGGLIEVTTPSSLDPNATVVLLVRREALARYLRDFARDAGVTSLMEAAIVGLIVYVALLLFLVRPMRRIIGSIQAFRADPERTPPLIAEATMPLRNDEMAMAARELGGMQRELRTALWRNARLAAIGTAVAKVSHDLRGILASALLAAERLENHADPSVKRTGEIIIRCVERATELVGSTLAFAREGPAAPERTPCALLPLIAEVAESIRLAAPGLSIDVMVPPGLEIDADRGQLARIFSNLLRNAADAQARHIRVEVSSTAAEISVVVSDDAGGLPESVREHLFRPFVPGARRGSTGLGLAIVRDLARAHGGDATLVETGPRGTSFRITLPAARSRKPRAAPAASVDAAAEG